MRQWTTVACTVLLILAVGAINLSPLSMPPNANATHQATECKWNFPWPREVGLYLFNSTYDSGMTPAQFNIDRMVRVSYGADSWSNAGFNLHFNPSFNFQDGWNEGPDNTSYLSFAQRGSTTYVDAVAQVYLEYHDADNVDQCDVDQGRPIVRAETIFNYQQGFHNDCLAAGQAHCEYYDLHDVHNASAHEFGHWFHQGHSGYPTLFGCSGHGCDDTMFGSTSPGEVKKRSISANDKDAARVMYGCRLPGC